MDTVTHLYRFAAWLTIRPEVRYSMAEKYAAMLTSECPPIFISEDVAAVAVEEYCKANNLPDLTENGG